MKIWEVHGMRLQGAIRSTSDGEADVAGLVLSEKAYLLALRDYRPQDLVQMVDTSGPECAARELVSHYGSDASLQASGGRGLVESRSWSMAPKVVRSDEIEIKQPAMRRR